MIKVKDIAYVRFGVPDLDAMETFSHDFGLVTVERSEDTLYSRGTDPDAYLHIAEKGDAEFRGLAFEAQSAEDLNTVTQFEGASAVEKIEAPGGGARVRLTDSGSRSSTDEKNCPPCPCASRYRSIEAAIASVSGNSSASRPAPRKSSASATAWFAFLTSRPRATGTLRASASWSPTRSTSVTKPTS